MSVSVRVTNDGASVCIAVRDRFDLHLHRDFRDCYLNEKADAEYIIDLSETKYIDSSALGMLLLLREFAGGNSSNITIRGYNENIKKILILTNFTRLFTCAC